jgi:hypothetical protein
VNKTTALVALSLALNVVLASALVTRNRASPVVAQPANATTARPTENEAMIVAKLPWTDPVALRAAGVPQSIVLRLQAATAFEKLQNLENAIRLRASENGKYWQRKYGQPTTDPNLTAEHDRTMEEAQREFTQSMRAAFGEEIFGGMFSNDEYGFLPSATREKVRRIEQDYDEMSAEITRKLNGVILPTDTAKLELLEREKARDVLAAMTPEERTQFQLRASPTANRVRQQWGDAIESEEIYRHVFALQKSFDELYPRDLYADGPPTPETIRARADADRKLEDDVRAVIGDDKYATFMRTNDPEYQTLMAVTARLNLSKNLAHETYALRDVYAARSMEINADATLSPDERSKRITALTALAKNDLSTKLGHDGAVAFAPSAPWLEMLKEGRAFSTNRNDASPENFTGRATSFPVPTLKPRPK